MCAVRIVMFCENIFSLSVHWFAFFLDVPVRFRCPVSLGAAQFCEICFIQNICGGARRDGSHAPVHTCSDSALNWKYNVDDCNAWRYDAHCVVLTVFCCDLHGCVGTGSCIHMHTLYMRSHIRHVITLLYYVSLSLHHKLSRYTIWRLTMTTMCATNCVMSCGALPARTAQITCFPCHPPRAGYGLCVWSACNWCNSLSYACGVQPMCVCCV